ncbi:GAF domain-containing protein [Desulfatibacillum alkenivorans DSM 16219]|jgi:signal transduction histidine kinase/CheY-like chemotaxis protein/PAS domain-containing protein|uniref:histidine kinase n=1 Tax=Desulfatibacillum alkenivorans DSM 16219 TaxID=1121393 RepID=A0A1M6VXR0_9BACT|nr:ATP-binding protein [Desulfatibacillum alkenivorans]SHK86270.1 GAF domain-containing protein [Desulfatibacillum alkenivorans DSM 16219]
MSENQRDSRSQQLGIISQFLRLVNSTRGDHAVFSTMVEGSVELLEAEAGVIALVDQEDPTQLAFYYTSGKAADVLRGERFPSGQGIIGWVVENDLPLVVNDVKNDPRFSGAADKLTGFSTHSAACAPIKSRGRVIGAIEILNKKKGLFSDTDRNLLSILVDIAALGFEKARPIPAHKTQSAPEPHSANEKRDFNRELEAFQAYHEAVLKKVGEGVMVLDGEAQAVYVNRTFLSFLRKNRKDVLGKKCHEIFFHKPEACEGCIKNEIIASEVKDEPAKRACKNLSAGGRIMSVHADALSKNSGENHGLMLTARDTTLLDRQMGLLKAANIVSGLCFSGKSASGQADLILAELGQAAGASRCYWFSNVAVENNKVYARQVAEWCASGFPSQEKDSKLARVKYPKRWRKKFAKGWFVSETESSSPDDAIFRFKSEDVQAILLIPLFVGGKFQGVIGFDNCKSMTPWRAAEASILKFAVDSFSRGLEREKETQECHEALGRTADAILVERTSLESSAAKKSKPPEEEVDVDTCQYVFRDRVALSQRMEVMGEIVSGVTHNFRNVLSGITANVQLMQMKYGGLDGLDRQTDALLDLASMGSDLIRSILQYSRPDTNGDKTVFDVTQLLREIYQVVSKVFDKRIVTHRSLPDPLAVYGNRSELGQVFMNLCTNARDAMPKGGQLDIQAVSAADGVEITISDTGHGMDAEMTGEIFKPFFTTKEPGKGTGLGLSTSYAIVKDHGGEIHVNSKVGAGTAFTVLLPHTSQIPKAAPEACLETITGQAEKILVIDDDKTFLEPLADLLTATGYTPRAVSSAVKGLQEYSEWKPDVVLLDRNMPDASGCEMVENILEINPDAKIIMMSGFDDAGPDALEDGVRQKISGYLSKPIEISELTQAIKKALDAGR